jgi:hypothetical protein
MTKFEDELLTDLMHEYGAALQPARPRPRSRIPRAVQLAAAAAATAGIVVGAVAGIGGGGNPAYAVTQNPDGSVTITISDMSGVAGTNVRLRALGVRAVAVPVQAGCPAITSLPRPSALPTSSRGRTTRLPDGGVAVYVQGIPPGDLVVIAVKARPGGAPDLRTQLTSGPVPRCVSW